MGISVCVIITLYPPSEHEDDLNRLFSKIALIRYFIDLMHYSYVSKTDNTLQRYNGAYCCLTGKPRQFVFVSLVFDENNVQWIKASSVRKSIK